MTYVPKHAKPKVKKFEITLVESERGWGTDTWEERFDTREEALARIYEVNKDHFQTTIVPEYYIIARNEVREVEV